MLTEEYYYYYYHYLRFLHTSVRWGFSSRVWVTASLLKIPGLLVLWTISEMLHFERFPFILLIPSRPIPVPIFSDLAKPDNCHCEYYFRTWKFFHISVSWWLSTGIWVTASLPESPELFSVFRPISMNSVVWTVSTHAVISQFSSSFIKHFVSVPRAPITFSIIVTFMFHGFFNSLAKPR